MSKLLIGTLLFSAIFFSNGSIKAVTKPKWEMGLGYYNFQLPHYYGSNHYYQYSIPLPTFNYRFDNLELGRDSKLYLFDSDFFQIDIALSANWPVFSDEEDEDAPDNADDSDAVIARTTNYTRRGMDDLPVTVFAGLRSRLFLTDHLIVKVPYFHGGKVESGFGHAGNTYEASVRLELFERDSEHEFGIYARNLYGDEKYNNFYYQVKESEVLPDREAYDAKAGLVAYTYGLSFFFQLTERLKLSGRYLIHNLEQSVIKDSPLVKSEISRDYYLIISYSFFLSDTQVNLP